MRERGDHQTADHLEHRHDCSGSEDVRGDRRGGRCLRPVVGGVGCRAAWTEWRAARTRRGWRRRRAVASKRSSENPLTSHRLALTLARTTKQRGTHPLPWQPQRESKLNEVLCNAMQVRRSHTAGEMTSSGNLSGGSFFFLPVKSLNSTLKIDFRIEKGYIPSLKKNNRLDINAITNT